ncbi:hypothetical protein M378DRAFT_170156 [Amanita muscaria Koide BX008]|uniref:Uncharacterized protein n=1 Tax=Amanita muscaria (strain Koide BX008) TaxID=946122 RepID=A0A0C2WBU6_AMAMK|nr:hypothetical protein M378DRAFT_170156 [Amanita muscaria Koide BX008]
MSAELVSTYSVPNGKPPAVMEALPWPVSCYWPLHKYPSTIPVPSLELASHWCLTVSCSYLS